VFEYFFTSDKIKLGITKNNLIAIKGNNYKIKKKNYNEILEYRIENNKFISRYNMPIYIATYYFNNNKLIKFRFGFPNL